MKGKWSSGESLAEKLKSRKDGQSESEASNQDSVVHNIGFVQIESASRKKCDVVLHRINRNISYGPPNEPNIDLAVDGKGNVIPPLIGNYMLGVSHFIPFTEHMDYVHNSFRDFKTFGCSLYGGKEFSEGIDFHQDRPLNRNNSSRKVMKMGEHYSIFPIRSMRKEEFEGKLQELKHSAPCSLKGGGAHTNLLAGDPPIPDYPLHDRRLREASAALFEMATNASIDPNRAFRALYFHYLLAEEDADYQWLLTGDALTYYCAHALEICSDSPNMTCEEIRDEIRCDLATVIFHTPALRSYQQQCSLVLFGENMS
eukprot:gene3191-3494_t